ncbi:MAG: RNA polymerase recycling motor HelD [Bacillus sp. (in: firmicutes)]
MAIENQERKYEEERINKVIDVIDRKVIQLDRHSTDLKSDVIHLRNTFWDDVKINMDHPEDAAETLSSIKQQSQLLSERERTHQLLHKQQKLLTRLKDSPYFARVDFRESNKEDTTHVYLGVASLMNEEETEFLIYDWRAPISSIYYDYSPGPVQYETIEGAVQGEMTLKRQFITKDGAIKTMFDTGVTIGDELLKEVLGNKASNNMKNIVATIQREQNQIIRNVKNKYLIVQGAAGSGKTSVALQRVAYLLYRYQNEITAENIMLFSPNALFNRYVASVLPDLGEENMQQMTFQEYAEKRLGKQFQLEHHFKQMEYMLTCEHHQMYAVRLEAISYKASFSFKVFIDAYTKLLSKQDLLFKSITFQGEMLISAEQIKQYFYSLPSSNSIPNRMQLVKEWLLEELYEKEVLERDKDWVLEESDLLDLEEYTKVYSELQKEGRFSENTFDDFERERSKIARQVVRKHFKPIRNAVKKLKFIHMKGIYRQLFSDKIRNQLFALCPENWGGICSYTMQKLRRNELTYEDTAPYLYLQDQLEGQRINTTIRHLVIDEAQDYSPFQFFVIQQLFPLSKMTILGDFNQAIYAHSFNAPTLLSSELYGQENVEKVILKKSYRSTRQIVEFTKGIMKDESIEAFDRNGLKPTFSKCCNTLEHHARLIEQLKQLQTKHYQTIAVICKTSKECKEAYAVISEQLDVQLMRINSNSYEKGVLILPAYLAKGIEFDAVLIYDASSLNYAREMERKLFYTACTRAMHELHLFSLGDMTPFMSSIPEALYEVRGK